MKATVSILIPLLLCACGGGGAPGSEALLLVSPSRGGVANEARPEIRWSSMEGAVAYRVRLYRDDARTDMIEEMETVATSVRPRGPLPDGLRVYVEIEALDADGAVLESAVQRFRVVLLPDFISRFRVVVHEPGAQGGYKLFGVMDRSSPSDERVPVLVLVNAAGEVVWWYRHPGVGQISDSRALPDGTIMFIARTQGAILNGYVISWDGTVLWKSRPEVQVHHECGVGPGGNYLYLKYIAETVDGVSYEADGIELVDPATNDVLWEWNMFDHFRPEDFQVPEIERDGLSGLGVDWSHSNAAVWDEERSLIWISIRHFDRIVGIDYPSGDVRVTIGAGGLGGAGYMSHQHAPEVQPDGSILFWDNGNGHDPQVSSAKLFRFDEQTGAFERLFEWTDLPPIYNFAVGDADRQPNGNFLVTAGTTPRIVEVDPTGRIVWDLRLAPDTLFGWIYRADQVDPNHIPPGILPFD